jgi:hypothetical protein
MNIELFVTSQRKNDFVLIMRRIYKESMKFQKFDKFIFQFIISEMKQRFESDKNLINLKMIAEKFNFGSEVLEDLIRIDIYNPDEISNKQINYLVYTFIII